MNQLAIAYNQLLRHLYSVSVSIPGRAWASIASFEQFNDRDIPQDEYYLQ